MEYQLDPTMPIDPMQANPMMVGPAYDATSLGSQMMDAPLEEGYQPEGEEVQRSASDIVDGEIRAMVLKRKEASRTFFQYKREIWDKCWNHYKQVYDKTNKESWQSTTFIPVSPKISDIIASNLHSALLTPDQPVQYQARAPQFEQAVLDVNDLIAVDMEKCQFKVHATDMLRSLAIIGTSIGKVEYKKEYADVQIKERVKELPMMGMARRMLGLPPAPNETVKIERKVVKDFASLKNVDRYDIYPEPGSTEICKDNWIIERGKICNYKLIELAQDPEHPLINITDEMLMNNPRQMDDEDKQEKDAAMGELNKVSAYLDPDQEHDLLEYWGPAPRWMVEPELYGDESRKYEMVHAWFWLIDGQYVVRREHTPWRDAEPPYVKGVYIRVPGQFDGIGPLELIMGLQIELNERVNCQQDEINLKLSGITAINKDMIPQGEFARIKSGPGALWLFSGTDDVRKAFAQLNFDLNLGDSWRAIQWLLNEIQEASGAVKAVIGNDGGGGDGSSTFRGQVLNKQVASERFIMNARILEETAFSAAMRKMYQRIYQFKGYEDATKILGEKRGASFEFIAPEDLEIAAKVVPLGVTSMENKGVQLAQMAEEFKMFESKPWFKQVEAARKMVIQRGQSDPDTIIFTDDELKQLNEARRQMMQMGQDPMGGGQPGQPPMDGGMPPGPIAGGMPGPNQGQPMPAMGPGASPIDFTGRPLS